jgi:hypothetical protein
VSTFNSIASQVGIVDFSCEGIEEIGYQRERKKKKQRRTWRSEQNRKLQTKRALLGETSNCHFESERRRTNYKWKNRKANTSV